MSILNSIHGGTLSSQNADNVAITGGSIEGVTELSGSVTTTAAGAPASTEAIAFLGVQKAIADPSAATSAGVYTGIMRVTEADSSAGAWTGTSHAVGGFDRLVLGGANNYAQNFGHEVRIENNCTGTITELTGYKPVYIGATGSTVTTFTDYPEAAYTLNGTAAVTTRYYTNIADAAKIIKTAGKIEVGKDIDFDATITAPGTTGNQTINKSAGRVNIAIGAGAAGIVVTNNLVTANSIVIAQPATIDATAYLVVAVVPTAGSFTIYMNANATAELPINWLVVN